MSPFPLPRRPARRSDGAAQLPAPGPFPAARPPRHTAVIFVIILLTMVWLLVHGYHIDTAFEVVSMVGVLAAAIASRLTGTQPVDG